MSRRALLGRALLALAFASSARAAGEAAGTAAGSFLAVGAGTSVLSMAGATVAGGRDLAAASWNVASLARLDAMELSFAHSPLPGGATQDWAAGGGRLGGAGTRWGLHALFHREGDLDGRDAANNPTGSLSVNDLAVGASLAQPLGAFVSAGVGVDWVHESLAGTNGAGLSFDAGLRADAGALGFALAARHVGGTMRYPSASYDLPQVLTAGVSWTDASRGLRVNADFESPAHYYPSTRVGGEWLWHDRVAVRAGYRLAMNAPSDATVSGPAFGVGAGVGTLWVDYAFLLDGGTTGGEHRVGLTFHPGLSFPGAGERRGVGETNGVGATNAVKTTPEPAIGSSVPFTRKPVSAPPAAPTSPPAPPPVTAPAAPASPAPATVAAPPVRPSSVVVAEGETLAGIAKRWGTEVNTLMMLNNMVSDRVAVGQRLKLPAANHQP